ncbi:DinB family protein [Occallatibacter savannae]|uniref:DinB family protein n=1 Tax=Occallatibacter savannae TaxID=1002691 RepID=UPI000D685DF7|nr:DinB family protein [Occallatibacter savannae]
MARTKVFARGDVLAEVVRSFAVNEEINQLLIEKLDSRAWRVPGACPERSRRVPRAWGPGTDSDLATRARSSSSTRTIAAIFAHMHHVRRKWIRLSAPHLPLPAELDRNCTQAQACKALAASGALCVKMIEHLLTASPELNPSPEKSPKFLRDGWARAWPAGPMMVAYMITHEAHHRGQVCMLANQLGFKLPGAATSAMWRWESLTVE